MIGSCNCPITANCPITLSDYNFAEKLEQNTPVYAPITCEEIVIVMIKVVIAKNISGLNNWPADVSKHEIIVFDY